MGEVDYVRMLVWEESRISLDLIICSHCFGQRVHVEVEAFVRIVYATETEVCLSVGGCTLISHPPEVFLSLLGSNPVEGKLLASGRV